MPESTTRRSSRAARPRYRALTTITYPTDLEDRRRRRAGERQPVEHWSKVLAGEPVPDFLIDESPWLVRTGQVELIPQEPAAEPGGEE